MPDTLLPAATPPPKVADIKQAMLVLFPGESQDGDVTRGGLYACYGPKVLKRYDACAGPAPGAGFADAGGHNAEATPAGNYILGEPTHHVSRNWPLSTIPWGAKLRLAADQDVEFSADNGRTWQKATGEKGVVTQAAYTWYEKTRRSQGDKSPLSTDDKRRIHEETHGYFFADGELMPEWLRNDFGKWAWNLRRSVSGGGTERTAYFVHTTPNDETATAAGQPVNLTQSHGCIHIRPADRDELITAGYLVKSMRFVVKPYGKKGP